MGNAANTKYSAIPFRQALAELLFWHQGYQINYSAFAEEADIVYTTLMSSISRGSQPSSDVMEKAAAALGIEPSYFHEYRVHKIYEAVAAHPELSGKVYELVIAETATLVGNEASASSGKGSRRGKRALRNRVARTDGQTEEEGPSKKPSTKRPTNDK